MTPNTSPIEKNSGARARSAALFSGLATAMAIGLGLALLIQVIVTPLDLETQTLFAASLFSFSLILNRFKGQLVTITLMLISIIVSTRYLYWRSTMTIDPDLTIDSTIGAALLFAEVYAYVVMLLGYFQTALPLKRTILPLPDDVREWPSVDVFIPTYNEPLSVVRATVLAAKAMDWPATKLNVFILDDGHRDEFRAFAAKAHVGYLDRGNNAHAKAGNLNSALAKTRGEYVAIFDCDHVPTRSFLQLTMGWLVADPKIALVQTPHHFYSQDPFERNLQIGEPSEGRLFYGLIQPGNDLWNAAFFCGSCAVLRRSALEEVGGIAQETVTEDAHTALRLSRARYDTAYIDVPQAAGLATESLSAHIGQRIRWARGMAQIFRIDNPLLGRGLTVAQRLCYANAMLHFFYGVPRVIFLLAPLAYLVFEARIFNAAPFLVLAYAIPHISHAVFSNSRVQGAFRTSFWGEVYQTSLAFYLIGPTTLALINPRSGAFNVTAKGGYIARQYFDRRMASPYLVLIALNIFGIAMGIWRALLDPATKDVVLINVGWAIYNLVILGAAVAVAFEKRQVRRSPRVHVRLPVMLRLASEKTVRCETTDLALTGASLKCTHMPSLEPGEALTLSLFIEEHEFPIPARVSSADGRIVRLAFEDLSLEHESWLVRAIFSRADAWSSPLTTPHRDQPVRAMLSILGHAIRTLVRTFSRTPKELTG